MQQKILRAEEQKEIGRWKCWWRTRDLLADGRCSRDSGGAELFVVYGCAEASAT